MRTFIILITIILSFCRLYSQEPVNVRNENGKQGKWVYFGKDRPESKYPDSAKVSIKHLPINNINCLEVNYYKTNNSLQSKIYYVNGKHEGEYELYWSNGFIKEKGTFYGYKRVDTLKTYHSNGKLKKLCYYDAKGNLNGKYKVFHYNGNLSYEANYAISSDEKLEYTENYNSLVKQFSNFKTNEKVNQFDSLGAQGLSIFYGKDFPDRGYSDSTIVEIGNYVNNRKNGIWILYSKDGKTPIGFSDYTKGILHKTYVSKYPFSNNSEYDYFETYQSNSVESGRVNCFSESGCLEYTCDLLDGSPIGVSYRFCENGDTNEIIEYSDWNTTTIKVKECEYYYQPEFSKNCKAPKIDNPYTKGQEFKQNGYNKVYSKENELLQDGIFKDGILYDGKEYIYDRDWILLKVKIYKNGFYHSDGQL